MFDDVRATQTRPRFYVSSDRRGATLMSNTQDPHPHWPGNEPGPLAWEADVLTTGLSRLWGVKSNRMTVTTVTFEPFYCGLNALKVSNVYIFEFSIPRSL